MSIKPQTSASCDEALFLTSADVSKDFSMTFCKAFEDRESGWITNKCKTNLMEVTQSNKGDWNLYFFGFPFDFFFFSPVGWSGWCWRCSKDFPFLFLSGCRVCCMYRRVFKTCWRERNVCARVYGVCGCTCICVFLVQLLSVCRSACVCVCVWVRVCTFLCTGLSVCCTCVYELT